MRLPDGNPPAEYEGATQVCFPEGFALALEERVDVVDSERQGSSANDRVTTMAELADNAISSGGRVNRDDANAMDDGQGCSVAPRVSHIGQGWQLVPILAALARIRRRRP